MTEIILPDTLCVTDGQGQTIQLSGPVTIENLNLYCCAQHGCPCLLNKPAPHSPPRLISYQHLGQIFYGVTTDAQHNVITVGATRDAGAGSLGHTGVLNRYSADLSRGEKLHFPADIVIRSVVTDSDAIYLAGEHMGPDNYGVICKLDPQLNLLAARRFNLNNVVHIALHQGGLYVSARDSSTVLMHLTTDLTLVSAVRLPSETYPDITSMGSQIVATGRGGSTFSVFSEGQSHLTSYSAGLATIGGATVQPDGRLWVLGHTRSDESGRTSLLQFDNQMNLQQSLDISIPLARTAMNTLDIDRDGKLWVTGTGQTDAGVDKALIMAVEPSTKTLSTWVGWADLAHRSGVPEIKHNHLADNGDLWFAGRDLNGPYGILLNQHYLNSEAAAGTFDAWDSSQISLTTGNHSLHQTVITMRDRSPTVTELTLTTELETLDMTALLS